MQLQQGFTDCLNSFYDSITSIDFEKSKFPFSFSDLSKLYYIRNFLNDFYVLNELYPKITPKSQFQKLSASKIISEFQNELEKAKLDINQKFVKLQREVLYIELNALNFNKLMKKYSEFSFRTSDFGIYCWNDETKEQKNLKLIFDFFNQNQQTEKNWKFLQFWEDFIKKNEKKQFVDLKKTFEKFWGLNSKIIFRKKKENWVILILPNGEKNYPQFKSDNNLRILMKLADMISIIKKNEILSKIQYGNVLDQFLLICLINYETRFLECFYKINENNNQINILGYDSKVLENYKGKNNEEEAEIIHFSNKIYIPVFDLDNSPIFYLELDAFGVDYLFIKSKINVLIRDFYSFFNVFHITKINFNFMSKVMNTNLIFLFDKNNELTFQNKEIPANLKNFFNFQIFQDNTNKSVNLNDILQNNPILLSKIIKEIDSMIKNNDDYSSIEDKPSFDILIYLDRFQKLKQYGLIIHNEKSLIIETLDNNNKLKKSSTNYLEQKKIQKYISNLCQSFKIQNQMSIEEAVQIFRRFDREQELKTPLKRFLEELKSSSRGDLSFLTDYSSNEQNFFGALLPAKRKTREFSGSSKRMSLALTERMSSKKKSLDSGGKIEQKYIRKLPHSKTFLVNEKLTKNKEENIDLIEEIGDENSNSDNPGEESVPSMQISALRPEEKMIAYKQDLVSTKEDYESLNDWNFDVIGIHILDKYRLIATMFHSLGYFEKFEIDLNVFGKFMFYIQEKYNIRNNPFHNFEHGITVCHGCYYIIKNKYLNDYLDEFESFALLFSALCHDVDHTGKTNAFEVSSFSKLSLKYNDESVLENHHCSLTFKILCNEDANILINLSEISFKYLRKLIISNILNTDMKRHVQLLSEFEIHSKEFKENPLEMMKNENNKKLLCGTVIHSCDLYSATKKFTVAKIWADKVNEEFLKQAKEEEKLGIPITSYMKDLDKIDFRAKSEIGFIKIISKPLWTILNAFFDDKLKNILVNFDNNLTEWENILEKNKEFLSEGNDNLENQK